MVRVVQATAIATRTPLALALAAAVLAPLGCADRPPHADLPPTLSLESTPAGAVAVQSGIPVPSFERQPRPSLDLGGEWRVEHAELDVDATLTERSRSLPTIEAEAAGRTDPGFDDSRWGTMTVPGALNPPPERVEQDAWLRRRFTVPADWAGRAITLKFGAVNYVADVWLNGRHLGYHEGGYTPFAFDAGTAVPGAGNTLAVRVVNPPWGSRNDIVPWGLADWWNFGGITRDVWMEASDPAHVVRADVVPHLDGADIRVVLHNRSDQPADVRMTAAIHPASVDEANLLDPRADALIAPGSGPVVASTFEPATLPPGGVLPVDTTVAIRDPTWWSPREPALYVLEITLERDGVTVDRLVESFGLRTINVDPERPGLRLNAAPVTFRGAALHGQRILTSGAKELTSRPSTPDDIRTQLDHARRVNVDLIRAGHTPADPTLLRLADRLGFAVWTEIPLYHYTPLTFGMALERGVAQQMLREMALRDMNRPSVLFHGLANESTGQEERRDALARLHEVDREIDGTRLTGQAAYAFDPDDSTSEPLDVAGYTSYFGVFYGTDPRADTIAALDVMHATFPTKPVMVLEMGRWADGPSEEPLQREILERTASAIDARDARRGGFVAAAVWWTLEDYWTMRPNIDVEHFGLFAADGRLRSAGAAAIGLFEPHAAGLGAELDIRPSGRGRAAPEVVRVGGPLLLRYTAFGLATALASLVVVLGLLQALPRRRAR